MSAAIVTSPGVAKKTKAKHPVLKAEVTEMLSFLFATSISGRFVENLLSANGAGVKATLQSLTGHMKQQAIQNSWPSRHSNNGKGRELKIWRTG
jgi:ABC-type hemin transport system ATPase subunit